MSSSASWTVSQLLREADVELRRLLTVHSDGPMCESSLSPAFPDKCGWGGGTEMLLGLWGERILISRVVSPG